MAQGNLNNPDLSLRKRGPNRPTTFYWGNHFYERGIGLPPSRLPIQKGEMRKEIVQIITSQIDLYNDKEHPILSYNGNRIHYTIMVPRRGEYDGAHPGWVTINYLTCQTCNMCHTQPICWRCESSI